MRGAEIEGVVEEIVAGFVEVEGAVEEDEDYEQEDYYDFPKEVFVYSAH